MPPSLRVHHEQCPRCRATGRDSSGDNLACYPDGHKYCFACGYVVPATQLSQLNKELKRLQGIMSDKVSLSHALPDDVDLDFSVDALSWLKQYGITEKEILDHNICYSVSKEWLIFPYYNTVVGDDEDLIAWQARSFDGEGMRWKSFGPIGDVVYPVGDNNTSTKVVIVEDIVSAIKVGRVQTTVPLFGSDRTKIEKMIQRLSRSWQQIVFWLDRDAQDRAVWAAMQCPLYACRGYVIATENDPKTYDEDEINAHMEFLFKPRVT